MLDWKYKLVGNKTESERERDRQTQRDRERYNLKGKQQDLAQTHSRIVRPNLYMFQ